MGLKRKILLSHWGENLLLCLSNFSQKLYFHEYFHINIWAVYIFAKTGIKVVFATNGNLQTTSAKMSLKCTMLYMHTGTISRISLTPAYCRQVLNFAYMTKKQKSLPRWVAKLGRWLALERWVAKSGR
jgi:hypothetical protein